MARARVPFTHGGHVSVSNCYGGGDDDNNDDDDDDSGEHDTGTRTRGRADEKEKKDTNCTAC